MWTIWLDPTGWPATYHCLLISSYDHHSRRSQFTTDGKPKPSVSVIHPTAFPAVARPYPTWPIQLPRPARPRSFWLRSSSGSVWLEVRVSPFILYESTGSVDRKSTMTRIAEYTGARCVARSVDRVR